MKIRLRSYDDHLMLMEFDNFHDALIAMAIGVAMPMYQEQAWAIAMAVQKGYAISQQVTSRKAT